MAMTIAECVDDGIANFRASLATHPHMPASFSEWFNARERGNLPDWLKSEAPDYLLERCGRAESSKYLLIWFDALSRDQQAKEAIHDIEALLEDNGHI